MPIDRAVRALGELSLPSRLRYPAFLPLMLGVALAGEPALDLELLLDDSAAPQPLAAGDEDGDGLFDDEEAALAGRFAPIVVLDGRDPIRPASIDWLAERVAFTPSERPRAVTASVAPRSARPFEMPESTRAGSSDPRDWVAYAHVYPRTDGGINVQYWFYYPYNDGPLFFDHDSDWEHVTVRLDASRAPVGAYLARHEEDHPGQFWSWSSLRKEDDHVVVVSALGTHASYVDGREAPWFERTASCDDLSTCADPVWRIYEAGHLVNLGERARPLLSSPALAYPGRWGRTQLVPGTSAPFGPTHHRGFCAHGHRRCREGG